MLLAVEMIATFDGELVRGLGWICFVYVQKRTESSLCVLSCVYTGGVWRREQYQEEPLGQVPVVRREVGRECGAQGVHC